MRVNDLLTSIYCVKEGAKSSADIVSPESKASLPVQHTARRDDVRVFGLNVNFPSIENERFGRFATKDHHLVLIKLNGGHRRCSNKVRIVDLDIAPVLLSQGVSVFSRSWICI